MAWLFEFPMTVMDQKEEHDVLIGVLNVAAILYFVDDFGMRPSASPLVQISFARLATVGKNI